ncbi:hypothetical protein T265_06176 [Opisthorchis viverrini]|uniref:Peptidase M16 N-terminal domain-containing protein n=1 Tax=Opisthorchis viverrini TaxID=6198 RepID=A0A074ZHA9_OPIVI|nr:hypothetical protein T265_06176 [Opisthorchis viverrini]KER26603.1 hypothetical protein T265_06176 [Opisthorchis viverrini]
MTSVRLVRRTIMVVSQEGTPLRSGFPRIFGVPKYGGKMAQWLERGFTDRFEPTSASRYPLSRLGQVGIPALVFSSDFIAARRPKDFIIYAVSGLTAHLDRLVHVLSETVLRSRITTDEVGMAARSIGFELQAMQRAPPVEPVITELLHGAAFGGEQPQTLGLPRYCPLENLEKITRDDIISFLASYYRDFIIYAVSGLTAHLDRLVHVLSETVLRSRITTDEVGMAARSIGFELQAMQRAPPVEPVITELLHGAAFGGEQPQTLGLPRYCPLENLEKITRDDIISFLASYYRLIDLEYADDIVLVFEEEKETQCAPTKCNVMLMDMQLLNTPLTV